jgi:hypothetical protein
VFVDNFLGEKVNLYTEVFIALHWCHQIEVSNVDSHEFGIVGGDDAVEEWCGERLSASKSNTVNLIIRLFLYHCLHKMSL